jgi:hypothetical protein
MVFLRLATITPTFNLATPLALERTRLSLACGGIWLVASLGLGLQVRRVSIRTRPVDRVQWRGCCIRFGGRLFCFCLVS